MLLRKVVDVWGHAMRIALKSPWLELAAAAGSVGDLAAALRVSRRTIERWSDGSRECKGPALELARRWAALRGIRFAVDDDSGG